MSLLVATFAFGLVVLLCGVAYLAKPVAVSAMARAFPRSAGAGKALMLAAMAWTLWKVWHLGPLDYGDFKRYILIGFLALGLAAFRYAADFLSVRAGAVLYLFCAYELLNSAWMRYESPQRLVLVVPVYLGIALSLYLAYAPYRLRDFFDWCFSRTSRAKALAGGFSAYGLASCLVAFTY